MLENLIRSIGAAVGVWMYVIAGVLVFAEASIFVGFVLPGETALLVAGVFTRPPGHLNLWVMIIVAVACAVSGDTVGYEIGQRFGPKIRASRLGSWIGEKRWEAAESFVHRHGGKAVFLGRLVALMRALTPAVAGMTGLPYRRFLPWNAAGGLVWGAGCVLLGWAFASALGVIGRTLTWAPLAIAAAVLAVVVVVHLRRRRTVATG